MASQDLEECKDEMDIAGERYISQFVAKCLEKMKLDKKMKGTVEIH